MGLNPMRPSAEAAYLVVSTLKRNIATPYICFSHIKILMCIYFEVMAEIPSLCVMEFSPLGSGEDSSFSYICCQ